MIYAPLSPLSELYAILFEDTPNCETISLFYYFVRKRIKLMEQDNFISLSFVLCIVVVNILDTI